MGTTWLTRRIHHRRREWTTQGPDPWAMVSHTISLGRATLTVTDGPARVGQLRWRGHRGLFISEVIHPRLFPIIVWMFDQFEQRYWERMDALYDWDDRGLRYYE